MKLKELPRSVKIYVQQCGGVIVGSAAVAGVSVNDASDIDVIIPFSCWKTAVVVAAAFKSKLNSYGGLRYQENERLSIGTGDNKLIKNRGVQIDVWPGELSEFIANGNVKYLWFPQQDYYWMRNDAEQNVEQKAGPKSKPRPTLAEVVAAWPGPGTMIQTEPKTRKKFIPYSAR